ncbi:hypothetical protein [Streptomyces sp. F001]|uniref:hypothetical protein n=1 Tax=Streptomyces sp. F001 TaxID=1510026 RepID=UPI0013EED521|nr:hypothetical protein [Streptomyces sp. F001]
MVAPARLADVLVTGRDWTTEVRERIIAPLRLRRTIMPGTWPFLPSSHAHNYQH